MLKTAFSTLGCPDWKWDDLLRFGTEYGYDGVEIRLLARETDLLRVAEFQSSQLKARRRELSESGFQICGLASSVRFDYSEAKERANQVEIGFRYIDLAVALGAGFVRVFGDVIPSEENPEERQSTIENIAAGLNRLGAYAEQADCAIVIETHGDYSDSRLMEDTLRRVESPAVGVLWDTHHPWRFYGEPLSETFERLEPWIRHTHWKDSVSNRTQTGNDNSQTAADEAHSLMSGHRHADYVLFGEGEFPTRECLRLLRESGYTGWYSLEWEKMWHPELADPEVALPVFSHTLRSIYESIFPIG